MSVVSEPLKLTIVFESDADGWVVASVPEVPGALSQGRNRDEARENVIDALHGTLSSGSASTRSLSCPPTASRSSCASPREASRPRATPARAWRATAA